MSPLLGTHMHPLVHMIWKHKDMFQGHVSARAGTDRADVLKRYKPSSVSSQHSMGDDNILA